MLQMDASIKGLGACLLQEEKPVYFASKALTDAQKGYMATEIESLVVPWPTEKFHHFLYASHFILETDQILIRTFAYHFTVMLCKAVRVYLTFTT